MKALFDKLWQQIKEFWSSRSKKQKKALIIFSALGLALIILLTSLFNMTQYEVLYANLDPAECGEILSRLEEMGVATKTKGEDTILVPKQDVARLKMVLASEGYPNSTSLNYDIFTNNINFMTTDFEKKQYLLFQLQERLQNSIKTIDGIKNAIVTISLPDNGYAVLKEDKISPSASAVLTLEKGAELTLKQIKGIEQLLVTSVPGLTKEQVSIIDSYGIELNAYEDSEELDGANTRYSLEKMVQNDVQKRVKDVLAPVYGLNKISVGVAVKLDFDKKYTEKTTYGDGKVVNEETTYEGTRPGSEVDTEDPAYNGDDEDGNPYYKETKKKQYLYDTTFEQIEKARGTITDLSVSVLLDRAEMTQSEINSITAVISKTCGIEESMIYVGNAVFADLGTNNAPVELPWWKISVFGLSTLESYVAMASVLLLMITMIVITAIIKSGRPKLKKAAFAAIQQEISTEAEEEIEDLVVRETKENRMKKQVQEFAATNPEITAQLIKTLIRGELD